MTPAVIQVEKIVKDIVLRAEQGGGMQIEAAFARRQETVYLDLTITNKKSDLIKDFGIRFNVNSFRLQPTQPTIQGCNPNQSVDISLSLTLNDSNFSTTPVTNIIQVAFKNNVGIYYFQVKFPLHVLYDENGQLTREEFISHWKNIEEHYITDLPVVLDSNIVQQKLQKHNIFYIAKRSVSAVDFLYFSAKLQTTQDIWILMEIELSANTRAFVKSIPDYAPLIGASLLTLLR